MKNLLSILIFLFIQQSLHSQDTIKPLVGNEIIAKVLEINKDNVVYKKIRNLDGPTYTLGIKEIEMIIYKNGEVDSFSNKPTVSRALKGLSDEELFSVLTKKHNKVFIDCADAKANVHAIAAIKTWGYWAITTNRDDADFVLKFNVRIGARGDAYGSVNFMVPLTGRTFKSTPEVDTGTSWDYNIKKAIVNVLVNKEIKAKYFL